MRRKEGGEKKTLESSSGKAHENDAVATAARVGM